MTDTLPQPATVSRKTRRLAFVKAPPGFKAMQRFIARNTGTTYAEGLTTRVPNLDTIYDDERLTNQRGAMELTPETIADCRRTFGRDLVTVATEIAMQERTFGRG